MQVLRWLTARRCAVPPQSSVAPFAECLTDHITAMVYQNAQLPSRPPAPPRGAYADWVQPMNCCGPGRTRGKAAALMSCCKSWEQLLHQRTIHLSATGASEWHDGKRFVKTLAAFDTPACGSLTDAATERGGIDFQQLPSINMDGYLPLAEHSNSSVRQMHSSSSSSIDSSKVQAASSSRTRSRRKLQDADQQQSQVQQQQNASKQSTRLSASKVGQDNATVVHAAEAVQQEACSPGNGLASHHQVQQQQRSQHKELQPGPQQQTCRLLLVGIDPDTNGALAVIAADLVPQQLQTDTINISSSYGSSSGDSDSNSCSTVYIDTPSNGKTVTNSGRKAGSQRTPNEVDHPHQGQSHEQQQQLYVNLSRASISVYDMPVEAVPLRKRNKLSPQRYRRRLHVARAIATIKKVLYQQQLSMQTTSSSTTTANSSSSNDQPVLLRAFLEVSSIVPTNGSLSTLNQGFSIGAWTAALLALGFDVSTVHVRHWKKDLGLLGRDKECSRTLAQTIYKMAGNSQEHLLSRKKDHGRAEALLVAAWGCGWSATDTTSNSSNGSGKKKTSSRASSTADSSSSSSNNNSSNGVGIASAIVDGSACDWFPWCGPLRDVIRMDGGMHVMNDGLGDGGRDDDDEGDLAELLMFGAAAVEPAAAAGSMQKSKKKSKKKAASKVAGDSSDDGKVVKGRRKAKTLTSGQ